MVELRAMNDKQDGINEGEVWVKFSGTHHYQRSAAGLLEYVKSDYFRVDPFGIERPEPISKADLIASLEPHPTMSD